MKSIVTGCAGFIGSHLSERLLDMGHEVMGIDCFTDYYSRTQKEENISEIMDHEGFNFFEKDIIDPDLESIVGGVDYVFHQAAQAGVRYSWGNSFDTYTRNNILATQRLLEACRTTGIKKFIYASSSSVYGDVENLPMKETDMPQPVSPYGVSKLAAEHLCYLYHKNFSVPTVSLRYFTVYGPRQRPDMAFNKFIKAILMDREIEVYGDGNQTRDYTFISDAVEANIRAMDAGSGVFNIGGGSRKTLNEVIETFEDLMDKKAVINYTGKQKGDVAHTYADTSRAQEILGYSPKINLRNGLKEEVEWLKKQVQTTFM